MEFADAMRDYFAGEKSAGATLAIYGVLLLVAAALVGRTMHGSFMLALAIPLVVLGLGATIGGIVLFTKTGPQLDALLQLYQRDVGDFLAQELPRMHKVNANWPRLEIAWTVLIAIGLASIWLSSKDWSHGLALALLVLGCTGMVLDVIAERRARVYTARIEALRPAPG